MTFLWTRGPPLNQSEFRIAVFMARACSGLPSEDRIFLSRLWDCFRRLLKNSGTNACSSASMDHRSVHALFSERGSGSGQEFRVSRKAGIDGWTRVCAHIDVRADLFATNMQSSVLKPDAFVFFFFSSKTRLLGPRVGLSMGRFQSWPTPRTGCLVHALGRTHLCWPGLFLPCGPTRKSDHSSPFDHWWGYRRRG